MSSKTQSARLPIADYKEEILTAVRENTAVIITAETGAGKSTQVPQYLYEAGYRVVVTQPRRLAARAVAQRVAEEMGTCLGQQVGFRTAHERSDSAATEVLFCTDGLQLVRELSGSGVGGKTVLVLDEVHEWNTNMEVLVAWTRQRIEDGDDLRIVLMSATLDAERLAVFYGNNTPMISVPGRLFPVEKQSASARDLVSQVAELAKAGRNVLVFQPGKKEIAETIQTVLAKVTGNAVVYPLHGQLDRDEQQRCFRPAPSGMAKVVVATNVAQTSITIPDIDAVVDSGVERRVELADGIEGLYLKPTSQADCLQRAGRAGRVKDGMYVLCSDTSLENRPKFLTAEVMRVRLDQMVLRLAVQGFDATALKFFHQPDAASLAEAKRALIALGAMSNEGVVTKIGRQMAKLPLSVQFSRMVVEGQKRGVVEDVITIAAILEVGGLRDRTNNWRVLTQETDSDLLAELDLWNACQGKRGQQLREMGIFGKDYYRAKEIRTKLLKAVRGRKLQINSSGEREQILLSCVAGMVDHLYGRNGFGYRNGGITNRKKARESVVSNSPNWITGLPKDIQFKNRRGRLQTLNLVAMITAVDPMWLAEVAPQLAECKTGLNPRYDYQQDCVVSTTQNYFNGVMVQEETVADGENPEAAKIFARWLSTQSGLPIVPSYSAGKILEDVLRSNTDRQKRAQQLNIRTGEQTFQVFSSDEMFDRFVAVLLGARRILEIVRPEDLALPTLNENKVSQVLSENPDTINVLGDDLVVEYRSVGYAPCLKLSDEMLKANSWTNLPDKGVQLPTGRLIEVEAYFSYYNSFNDTDVPRLKSRILGHLNRKLWDQWIKPEIKVPDLLADDAVIPFIVESYGTCIVTGDKLKAYGTLQAYRSWSSDPITWKPVWSQDLVEAQNVANSSAEELIKLVTEEAQKQAQAKIKVEMDQAKTDAEVARQKLCRFESSEYWLGLDTESRFDVQDQSCSCMPHTVEEIKQWIVETQAIIVKVEATLLGLQREAERKAAEEEKERMDKPADLSASSLANLFGGGAKVRK